MTLDELDEIRDQSKKAIEHHRQAELDMMQCGINQLHDNVPGPCQECRVATSQALELRRKARHAADYAILGWIAQDFKDVKDMID